MPDAETVRYFCTLVYLSIVETIIFQVDKVMDAFRIKGVDMSTFEIVPQDEKCKYDAANEEERCSYTFEE